MEAIIYRHSSADRNMNPPAARFFSYPTQHNNYISATGSAPLFNSYAVPPPPPPPFTTVPLINPNNNIINHLQYYPPLLPLPIPNNNLSQNNSPKRINNRTKQHQSLSVKRSSTTLNINNASPKREKNKTVKLLSSSGNGTSSSRLGPDPKDVPKVLFSGSVIGPNVLSPEPSSLPLPTFSLRPKLSCKAEAAAAGATDDLRRMLRIR